MHRDLALDAVVASTAQDAAKVYPPDYWFSLLEIPTADMFPGTGTGTGGNGFAADIETQKEWVHAYKSRCHFCHQQGNEITRSLWANYGTHLVWHIEGGKGTVGKMVQFQIRPDPLAN